MTICSTKASTSQCHFNHLARPDRKVYGSEIVDQAQGDGGVRWVNPNVDDPYIRADIAAQVYPGFDMEVPYYGNPYAADLANDYWGSVRNLVRTSLVDCSVEVCQPFQTRTPTLSPVK